MKTSTIFGQLTIEDISTSSAEGFPASRSVRPDGERGRKMIVTSSRRLSELLRKQGRSGSFLKTLLDCSPFSNPIVFLKWKPKRLSFFVRTTNSLQQVPSSDYNDGLSETSFQKSDQQDMYSPHLKTAHQRDRVWYVAHADRHRDKQYKNNDGTGTGQATAKGQEERTGQWRSSVLDGFSGVPCADLPLDTDRGNSREDAQLELQLKSGD